MGKVYLTGAGPGDRELLTLKALRVICQADAILYDRLINPEILQEAREDCELIYVGKEEGHHALPQNEINEAIYRAAQKYQTVVRLKGGDPFVLGRGGEEGMYLRDRGVECVFIPGVSSAVAVPEYAGIPLTHRGVSRNVRVLSGHLSEEEPSQASWESCQSDDTMVFLMGLHRLSSIVQKLLEAGKPINAPVAVISRGTYADQRTVVGTLGDICDRAKGLPTPALIVVGDVVRLRERLNWFEEKA